MSDLEGDGISELSIYKKKFNVCPIAFGEKIEICKANVKEALRT